MNEPSVFNGPEITMPKELLHRDGNVEHRDIHNLYGQAMHRATFEGMLQAYPDRRPFVLSRSFFAGSQRYGAAWTGDNKADWAHLAASVPMLLSLGVAGMPFVGADVGGFFGDPDAELLTRWYQLGAMQPFFRAHAHIETKRREPWLAEEPYRSHIRNAIIRRYKLLPYIYRLFYESHLGKRPVNRPMWMEFPLEASLYSQEDQFMLGEALLIKPIMAKGLSSVQVFLPKSSLWYNYDSLQRVPGGRITVDAGISGIPTFIRGGSIILTKEYVRRSTDAMRLDPYTILVAPDGEQGASGLFYVDDGVSTKSQALKEYLFARVTFTDSVLHSRLIQRAKIPFVALDVEQIFFLGLEKTPQRIEMQGSGKDPSVLPFEYDGKSRTAIVKMQKLISLGDDSWKVTVHQ